MKTYFKIDWLWRGSLFVWRCWQAKQVNANFTLNHWRLILSSNIKFCQPRLQHWIKTTTVFCSWHLHKRKFDKQFSLIVFCEKICDIKFYNHWYLTRKYIFIAIKQQQKIAPVWWFKYVLDLKSNIKAKQQQQQIISITNWKAFKMCLQIYILVVNTLHLTLTLEEDFLLK